MKKLRKLTRKGLDELANEMPQVSEIQQQAFVGGACIFDYYGNFLSEIGSDDIQVLSCTQSSTDSSGIALIAANYGAQMGVVNFFVSRSPYASNPLLSGVSLITGGSVEAYFNEETDGILKVSLGYFYPNSVSGYYSTSAATLQAEISHNLYYE